MSLHRCLDKQTVLVTAVVVVINVIFNGGNQLFPAGECLSVIAFTFQDSPEALHRAIVNTAANTGHTLRHSGIQQLLVKGSAGVLESTVTVEQWVSIWIFQNSFIKRIKNQLVVIPVTNNVADDSPVTQIEDRTQIELVDNWAFIPLKLCHIGQPLFIWPSCPELPVQKILCCYLWVGSVFGAALLPELHR